ncbi:MAG: formylglycine-generating enzyme family protein [Lewinellaceae bacterium]|nr:formylglycine-generating enzyme family protein [Saprospiraceae bacterium]MCB9337839.1 formylglycine-generating enzyme family protein [Lewinellaceae bacterium]
MPIKKSPSFTFQPCSRQIETICLQSLATLTIILLHCFQAAANTLKTAPRDTLPPLADSIKLPKALQSLELNMVRVDSGSFMMGCDANRDGICLDTELPIHKEEVGTFYLARYEIRQIDWLVVMKTDPSYFQGCDQCPVESVRWDDVTLFIETLNKLTGRKYRLPTEAEWEFAARGGNVSEMTRYAGSNLLEEVGWYSNEKNQNRPHAVGQKEPNELGLYDMSGNVWEWCSDAFAYYKVAQDTAKIDPKDIFRPIRGGSWNSLEPDCRIAVRNKKLPSYRYNAIGFRLAHDWQPPAAEPPKTKEEEKIEETKTQDGKSDLKPAKQEKKDGKQVPAQTDKKKGLNDDGRG